MCSFSRLGLCVVAMVLLSVDAEFPKVEIGFICPAIPSKALLSTHINVIWGNKLLLVHVGLPECGRNQVDSGTSSSGFNRFLHQYSTRSAIPLLLYRLDTASWDLVVLFILVRRAHLFVHCVKCCRNDLSALKGLPATYGIQKYPLCLD